MKYTGEERKYELSLRGVARIILVFVIPILAYGIAMFPSILLAYFLIKFLDFGNLFHIFIFSLSMMINYLLLVFSTILSTAFFINVLWLKYGEGEYAKTIMDKSTFKYTPLFRPLLSHIPSHEHFHPSAHKILLSLSSDAG